MTVFDSAACRLPDWPERHQNRPILLYIIQTIKKPINETDDHVKST
jgi:hypothetical protein